MSFFEIISLDWLKTNLQTNQFLIATLMGGALLALRETPRKIYNFIFNYITTEFYVTNEDDSYEQILHVLKDKRIEFLNRSFSKNRFTDEINTGFGRSWFIFEGKLGFVERKVMEVAATDKIKESVSITFLSRKKSLVSTLIKSIDKKEELKVYIYNRSGLRSIDFLKKDFKTIFIDKDIKTNLINRINEFLIYKQWYINKGIPYKFGILMSGKPGTGKTSLIRALATYLKKDIVFISCKSLPEYIEICYLENRLVVFEDFDSLEITKNRQFTITDNNVTEMSLSTLLNILDGILTPPGLIFIASTNYPDKLDSALTRKGRFDLFIDINELDYNIFIEMIAYLWEVEEHKVKTDIPNCLYNKPITGASLQSIFIDNREYNDKTSDLIRKEVW